MADVYLPYGYPAIQGASFDVLIYNGTVVRRYSGVTDPRTQSQAFERRLLSDVAKMRGAAGKWAKAVWRLQLGAKYTQVIYQLVRGDVGGYWSSARALWGNLSSAIKDAWRLVAPFQATYNDPGEVFFALARVLYYWAAANGQNYYFMEEPLEGASDEVAAWWTADLARYGFQRGNFVGDVVENDALGWVKSGTWTREYNGGYSGGSVEVAATQNQYMLYYWQGSRIQVYYAKGPDGGTLGVYIDGQQAALLDQNAAALTFGAGWLDNQRAAMNHSIRLQHMGPAGKVVRVDGLRVYRDYRFADFPFKSGTWVLYQDLGQGVKFYKTSGAAGSLSFPMVGAYVGIEAPKGPEFGTMRVKVDGVEVGTMSLNAGAVAYTPLTVFGRFKKTVHFVSLEAVGDGEIGIGRVVIGYKLADVGG